MRCEKSKYPPLKLHVHDCMADDCREMLTQFNPLPDMPILGSFNSAANKDMMSKIWTKFNGDTVI